ncbi:amyloid-like protein 2 [Asterias rubens]|uniref:amyloid-like protein 2 n=1 Tax=Asterias rubens TaxID=7604 RepID=UPI001455C0BD|nr:amyloid-like protein 2 [Asterias rubens]
MARNLCLVLICLTAVCSVSIAAYVEAVAGVFDISRGHVLPQVALRCGFLNKYTDLRTGEWLNGDVPSPCDISKNDILDYCRQVYSDLDVNNIEDSNEDREIRSWCPMDAPDIPDGCVETFTIPTYTCLVGDFESKALMVPKDCDFEHIHDSETCKPKSELHSQAEKQCATAGKTVRDFGMLLPCQDEVDLFTGVEFVCCPKQNTTPKKVGKPDIPKETAPVPPKVPEPEAPQPEVEPAEPATEPEPITAKPLPEDPYFKESFDEDEEHEAFLMAKQRMDAKEEDKRSQVMQQWEEAQSQYEALRKSDPKSAEAMKKGMMERFDNTMADLEITAQSELDQLRAVHQQRVGSALREQRTRAERLFTEALRDEPPKTKKILHLFQKFLKSTQRDRQHHMNIYKHLMTIDPARAQQQRRQTVERLHDIDSSVQSCFDMITKMGDVYSEIKSRVDTLLNSSQSPEDVAFLKSLEIALRMETPKEKEVVEEPEEPEESEMETSEEEVVDAPTPAPPKKPAVVPKKAPGKPSKLPKAPIVAKILPPKGKAPSGRKVPQVPDFPMIVAKITPEEPEVVVAVKGEALPMVKIVNAETPVDKATGEQPAALVEEEISSAAHIPIIAVKPLDHYLDIENENEDDVAVLEDTEEPATSAKALKPILVAKKQPQKSQKAAASRVDKSPEFRPQASSRIDNSVTQKSIKYGATPALAFGLACGVLAVATVMVVAVVLVRRKTRRVPVNHGFTEIDPNMTVEQRHIAAMQANGYENPTYKYFEMQ